MHSETLVQLWLEVYIHSGPSKSKKLCEDLRRRIVDVDCRILPEKDAPDPKLIPLSLTEMPT